MTTLKLYFVSSFITWSLVSLNYLTTSLPNVPNSNWPSDGASFGSSERSSSPSSSSSPSQPSQSSNCTSFYCSTSQSCIPYHWRCDGEADCYYGEDESNCSRSQCPSDQFYRCSDTGQCIQLNWRCDGTSDCSSGEDELNCQDVPCPNSVNYFKCKATTGKCITAVHVCDGINDCEDGEDESNRACSQFCTSKFDRYLCPNGSNGGSTLNNNFDSSSSNSQSWKPPQSNRSSGSSNVCIWNFYLCDGINDCPDGADESNVNCNRG